jgi:hypothetical protein
LLLKTGAFHSRYGGYNTGMSEAQKRRWFRFSIRTLLAVLVVSGPMTLLAKWYLRTERDPNPSVHPAITARELLTIRAAINAKSQLTEKDVDYIELVHPSVIVAGNGNWRFVFHRIKGAWVMTRSDRN